MKYGFGHGTYTMAIAGANAPVTPEGCAVQAAAEVLGSMTCISACDPQHLGGMLALTGTMDMRTGKALFSSPSAILQNIIVTEMFRRVHGVDVGCNWPWYTDAVVPGLQAALEHQTKQIIYAAHSGFPVFHVGDLDGAKLHSNEQMIIDLDVSRGVWEMLKPLAFDDQSLAVAEIERIGAEHGRTHLDSDFTLERHREALWNPRVLPRGYWREGAGGFSEADILDAAHAFYEKTVDAYEPGPLPAGFERDIRKVLDEAQEDLKNLKSG
jgi:trimethylamine:corrinoid methyltransferase-like protein